MATVYIQLPLGASGQRDTNSAQWVRTDGTNFPVSGYAFAPDQDEDVFQTFRAINYGSGNLTLDLDWYADTAATGNVEWGAQIGAITPNTDTQDIETKALATESTVNDTHLGTTGQRLHRATATISNLDSLAADDWVVLRIYRDISADTMAGDAILVLATLSYSDT